MQYKTKFFLILFMLVGVMCFAQDVPAPDPEGRGINPPGMPIDGGLAILIAAGAYYGIRKSLKH
ncbi:PID-CTERM protein-sorting domain-containing protein [Formosa undariae]|uniref:PID-CTERM protein-sorting domain-containing protein n=1 Tax=Formosa undariae TaxID=1325436 RepID=A0ABV5EY09_9FLAO